MNLMGPHDGSAMPTFDRSLRCWHCYAASFADVVMQAAARCRDGMGASCRALAWRSVILGQLVGAHEANGVEPLGSLLPLISRVELAPRGLKLCLVAGCTACDVGIVEGALPCNHGCISWCWQGVACYMRM